MYNAHDHFCFINYQGPSVSALDSLIQSLPENCRAPAEAFNRNLRGTVLTAAIPVQLALASLGRRNYAFIAIDERIKGGRKIHERVEKRLLKDMQSDKKREHDSNYILNTLSNDLQSEEMRFAASELIRQCTVQTWSALEVFASDMFVTLLNAKPVLAIALMEDAKTKRLFQLKGVSLEMLSEYHFNLSSSMGSVLITYHPVDSIPSMKAILGAILPNHKAVNRALSVPGLWQLFQRRHLIVHRRGIVDSNYLSATGDTIPLGAELLVSPALLKKYLELVLRAGLAIGTGVASALRLP